MKLEIAHNHEEFIRQNRVIWNHKWKKGIESQIVAMAIGGLFILISYGSSNQNYFTDDALFAIGVFMLAVPINYLLAYRKKTKLFLRTLENNSQELKGSTCIFEFTDLGIFFKGKDHTLSMEWRQVEGFRLHKKIIAITAKNIELPVFMITEKEIAPEKMEELVAFLKTKLKQYKTIN